ncbi:MAG: redoxin family protein [Rhodobacteraceae bacterium]|nr:redoxin family protein [Paracoccaceae bacterium]
MSIREGDTLPAATFVRKGPDEPEAVNLADLTTGRKIVVVAVPGAFTPTCHSAHMPTIIDAHGAIRAKGVDEVIVLSVNDMHVMKFWGEVTGAAAAGITLLADPQSKFTKAIGMDFTAEATGMIDRSSRYVMVVDDGVVTRFQPEDITGGCALTGGQAILDLL